MWTALLVGAPVLVVCGHGEDALALLAMLALAGRVRPGSGGSRLLAVLGLTLLGRCAFEPVVHVYYLAPGLCLLLLHERVASGRCGRTALLGGLVVAWFPLHPAPALWWAVTALLGGAVAYRAGREVAAGTASGTAIMSTGLVLVSRSERGGGGLGHCLVRCRGASPAGSRAGRR